MERRFICDKVVCEENTEEDYMMVAFSDNGDEPNEYVILQRGLTDDEQDIELGMNTYDLEYVFDGGEIIGYGNCSEILAGQNEVVFKFNSNEENVDLLTISIDERQSEQFNSPQFKQMLSKIIDVR